MPKEEFGWKEKQETYKSLTTAAAAAATTSNTAADAKKVCRRSMTLSHSQFSFLSLTITYRVKRLSLLLTLVNVPCFYACAR